MSEFIEVRQAAAHKIAAAVAFDLRKEVKTNFRGCRNDTAMTAADVIDGLMQQRAELLEALKGMHDIWQSTCNAYNWDAHHMYQFTKCVAAITKAEAAE